MGMELGGLLSVLILVGIVLFAMWIFFDVLGYTPSAGPTGAASAH